MTGLGKSWDEIYKEKDMGTIENVMLSESGLLHRDQDMLDYYLIDQKPIAKIAELVGFAHKNQVSTRLNFYRKAGVDIPSKVHFGREWSNGKKSQKRIVLKMEDLHNAREMNRGVS